MNNNHGNINTGRLAQARAHTQTGGQIRDYQRDQMKTGIFSGDQTAIDMTFRFKNTEEYTKANPRASSSSEAASKKIARVPLLEDLQYKWEGLGDVGFREAQQARRNQLLAQQDYAANYGSGAQTAIAALEDVTSLGKAYVGSEFFEFLDEEKKLAQQQQFEFFKMNMVDLSTPQGRSWWKRNQPELFEKKIQYLRDQMALEARAKELQILGPENEADMRFLYHFEQGDFKTSLPLAVNEPPTLFVEGRIEGHQDGLIPPKVDASWAVAKNNFTPGGNDTLTNYPRQ